MSADNLSDTRSLLARNDDLEEDQLQKAAYELLSRQFLLREKGRHRRHYELIVEHQNYFIKLMKATNHQLVVAEDRGFVGIIPLDYTRHMTLDETLLLLTLRYIYDEEINNFKANDDGSVNVTVEEFQLKYEALTSRDLPRHKGEFVSLMQPFIRCGVVDEGEDAENENIWRLHIYPTITALISGEALKRIEVYLKADDVDTEESGDQE